MARKNILADLTGEAQPSPERAPVPMPAVGPGSAFAARGAPGMLTRSIGDLAEKANTAKELEAKLTAGQVIVELDATLIDPSFITDRMAQNDEAYAMLRTAIAAEGQNSPILVRRHPAKPGRYQVAFGHRRLRVAQELGRPGVLVEQVDARVPLQVGRLLQVEDDLRLGVEAQQEVADGRGGHRPAG